MFYTIYALSLSAQIFEFMQPFFKVSRLLMQDTVANCVATTDNPIVIKAAVETGNNGQKCTLQCFYKNKKKCKKV